MLGVLGLTSTQEDDINKVHTKHVVTDYANNSYLYLHLFVLIVVNMSSVRLKLKKKTDQL